MSTRVTISASKRAKAALIDLLFPRQKTNSVSHHQLRKAYLQKIQILHPDKLRSSPSIRDQSVHDKFVQLQNAWEDYNVSARMFGQTRKDDDDDNNNFTMFGVGCSFSDSPEEKILRDEFMEQACKGWLPSGALSYSCEEKIKKDVVYTRTRLIDDDMFSISTQQRDQGENLRSTSRDKSLVQNLHMHRRGKKR